MQGRVIHEQAVTPLAVFAERLAVIGGQRHHTGTGPRVPRAHDPADRDKARIKRLVGNIEDWTGSLSDAQQAHVAAAARSFPRLLELQLDSRQARQQDLLALLKRNRTTAELAPALRTYFLGWESHRSSEYGRMAVEWERQLTLMLIDIDRTLSPEQRGRAVKRAAQFAEDFRVLSANKS